MREGKRRLLRFFLKWIEREPHSVYHVPQITSKTLFKNKFKFKIKIIYRNILSK